VQTGAAVGPGLGALGYAGLYAVLPGADRVAGAAGTRHDLNCVPPYIEIPLLEIEFGIAILRRWQFIPCQCLFINKRGAAERVCCSAESCRAQTLIDLQPDLRRPRTVTWLTQGREKARRHSPGLRRPHSAIPAYIT
jgi:hypothetical protein